MGGSMPEIITFSITVFMGFFAIMNPIANIPIFLGLVEDLDSPTRKQIAKTAATTAFFIVAASVVLGKYIFHVFGITIPAFKITGGILLFFVGFEMLMSKKSSIHSTREKSQDEGIAISPLAIPILAGPGTIVTAMNFITSGGFLQIGIIVGIFGLMILLTYLAFISSDMLMKKLGKNMITVIGKLMGLILAIMGTGMVLDGINLEYHLQ
jgi:multiple antibiotic resistance protein